MVKGHGDLMTLDKNVCRLKLQWWLKQCNLRPVILVFFGLLWLVVWWYGWTQKHKLNRSMTMTNVLNRIMCTGKGWLITKGNYQSKGGEGTGRVKGAQSRVSSKGSRGFPQSPEGWFGRGGGWAWLGPSVSRSSWQTDRQGSRQAGRHRKKARHSIIILASKSLPKSDCAFPVPDLLCAHVPECGKTSFL